MSLNSNSRKHLEMFPPKYPSRIKLKVFRKHIGTYKNSSRSRDISKISGVEMMSINSDQNTSVVCELSLLRCKLHAERQLNIEDDGVGISQFSICQYPGIFLIPLDIGREIIIILNIPRSGVVGEVAVIMKDPWCVFIFFSRGFKTLVPRFITKLRFLRSPNVHCFSYNLEFKKQTKNYK